MGNRKPLIISVCAALVIAAAFAAIFLVFPAKSARKFYLESEGKNFRKYSEHIKRSYEQFYSSQKPFLSSASKSRFEISADVKSDGGKLFGMADASSALDILKKCRLIVDSSNDPASGKSLTRMSLLFEKAPLLDASAYMDGKTLGFNVPVLLPDKYFTANMDRIDDVYKRFGVPFRPRRVPKLSDAAAAIKFSDRELDSIAREYGAFISSLISESDVRFGSDAAVNSGGGTLNGREVIVSLDGEKTKRLFKSIAGKISEDDTLIGLTYGNYADIVKILDEAGLFQLFDVLDSQGMLKLSDSERGFLRSIDVKKDLQAFKDSLKTAGSEASFPGGLKMTLVVDKSQNILDRKLTFNYMGPDGRKTDVNIHSGTNDVLHDNFDNGFCQISLAGENSAGEKVSNEFGINTNIKSSAKNGYRNGSIEIKFSSARNSARDYDLSARFDIGRNTDETTLKTSGTLGYDVRFISGAGGAVNRVAGEIASVSSKNNKMKTRNTDSTITVNAELPLFGTGSVSAEIGLKREDRFDYTFEIPAVRAKDVIDLNSIPDGKLKTVTDEITASLAQFYMQNQPLVDALLKGRQGPNGRQ